MCVDEGLKEEGWGVTGIYVITYQMKQEGCVNQRVNTQLDKSVHPVSACGFRRPLYHTPSANFVFWPVECTATSALWPIW